MQTVAQNYFGRREFLKMGAVGAGAMLTGELSQAVAKSTTDPYGGFKMGIQSYSLRGFDAKTALAHTKKLGLKYWEAYRLHISMDTLPKIVKEQKALLASAGVTLLAYGVINFDANETKARQAFDFAKAMGIISISANPKKNKPTFDLLDKLVAEYDVAIAIHNHGPNALYDKIDDVVNMVKDRHPKIGACVDTGHYIRSNEDPVEALERFGKRVHGVHLKDVKSLKNGGKRFTILGQGDLDVLGCLRVLRKLKFQNCMSLEYEENKDNPLSDIEVCLKAVRDAVVKLD